MAAMTGFSRPAFRAPTVPSRAAWLVLFFAVLTPFWPAKAEYHLQRGDVVELSAAGVPDIGQKSMIGLDGQVSFSLLGQLPAAGLTLADLRSKIQALLPTKVFRRRSPEGREYPIVIAPDEINLKVAQYRPVYLNGDVSKPGEQEYRPGMTVHQAIALAGGYEIMRFRMNNPFLDAADFNSQLHSLQLEYAKQFAITLRLQAELQNNKSALDQNKAVDIPQVPLSILNDIAKAEAEQLRLRSTDFENEKSYLQNAINSVAKRVTTLSDQERKEQDGAGADLDELKRIRTLSEKGTLPFTRVTEARRMALLSSTSALQTGSMLGQAVRERQDLNRKLQKLPEERRSTLVRELEDAKVNLEKLSSQIQGVKEKLAYTGILRSQLAHGESGRPKLVIFRTAGGHRERIDAEEYTELQPGDLVEVAIRTEYVGDAEQKDSANTHSNSQ